MGKCNEYKFKYKGSNSKKYELGASRCNNTCMIFIDWNGLYCPCCSMRLRKSRRNHNKSRNIKA